MTPKYKGIKTMRVSTMVLMIMMSAPSEEERKEVVNSDADDRFKHGDNAVCMRFQKLGCRCQRCNPPYCVK